MDAIVAVKENLKLGKPADQDYGLFTQYFSQEEKVQRLETSQHLAKMSPAVLAAIEDHILV